MSGAHSVGPLRTVGAVLEGSDGRVNLRSLAPAFLKPFFPVDLAQAHLRAEPLFSYAPTEGTPALRQHIAMAAGADPADVVVTDGASQAILLLLLAGLERGDTLLVPRPVFPAYLRIAASRGCFVRFYDWRANGAALLEQLDVAGGKIDGVIVNSPHNPTGIPLGAVAWQQIAEALARLRGLTILDETYCWLEPGTRGISRFSQISEANSWHAGLAAVGSLGKLLCLPGLRLGYIITRDRVLRDAVVETKRHLAHASCSASEQLACALLVSPEWQAGRKNVAAALDARRREFGKVTLHGVHPVADGCGFYAYADNVAALTALGVDGIAGPVFEGAPIEARFCLASSAADWARFTNLLGPGEVLHAP